MNSKIINPSQYKKITKDKNEKRTEKIERKIRRGKYEEINIVKDESSNDTNLSVKKRIIVGIVLICIMASLSILSASFFDLDKIEYIAVINNVEENIVLNNDFEFKVGILNLDESKNVVINELKNKCYRKILSFDEKYNITLDLAENIDKKDSKTYVITFKEKSIKEKVKEKIENIIQDEKNVYYSVMKNISKLDFEGENSLAISLKEENDYFVYYLDFNVDNLEYSENLPYTYQFDSSKNVASFTRKEENNSVLKKITVNNYNDSLGLVNDFKDGKIDMFLTSSDDDIKALNRYDYNLKKYRDGESIFLLGNPKSKLFREEEVRKAIAYSIDRNAIAKEISLSYAEVIDIPYIYSEVSYKYDTYAVDSLLSSNKWEYKNGTYVKSLDNKNNLTLKIKILVNSDDNSRLLVASMVKEMLEKNKIPVELIKVSSSKMNEALAKDDYDMAIAKVSLGVSPDISYLYNYINITDEANEMINNIKNANVNLISSEINKLKDYISSKVLCIGIYAKNVDVITQKYLKGFEEINYMNIFSDLESISK